MKRMAEPMTIAIAIKVHDGIVLASDSASTMTFTGSGTAPGQNVNVYNNANKIFNLCKGFPIGGMTWGSGSIGRAPTSTLAKDLRKRFSGGDRNHKEWALDLDKYSIEEVAVRTRRFLFDEHYNVAYGALPADQRPGPLGFLVSGYSSESSFAEAWLVDIKQGGACDAPKKVVDHDQSGFHCAGEPEVVQRILFGHGSGLSSALEKIIVDKSQVPRAVEIIEREMAVHLIVDQMPIQDLIDLSEFLVHAAIMFSRFKPGAPSVGGPIEVAAITKHEGFKWVSRKYYFDSTLNPNHNT